MGYVYIHWKSIYVYGPELYRALFEPDCQSPLAIHPCLAYVVFQWEDVAPACFVGCGGMRMGFAISR